MSLLLTAEATDDLNVFMQPLVADRTVVTVTEVGGWSGQGIVLDVDFEGVEFLAVPADTIADSVSWETIAALVATRPELHTTRRIPWDRLTRVHIW